MKKILLAILLSLSFIYTYGMEEDNKQLQHIQTNTENTISHEDLIELYAIFAESLHPNKTQPKVIKKLLAIVQSQAVLRLPPEMILHIINSINFASPIEFLKFLIKLSSLNKHFRTMINPHIIDLVSLRFALDKESVEEFLELVFGRSGMPSEYLEELLNNKDKREKIKQLKILYESNPIEAIKQLGNALDSGVGTKLYNYLLSIDKHDNKCKEAMDIIMALPKKIFYYDLGKIITKLIDSDDIVLLKMLIGTGININCILYKLGSERVDYTPLMYAVYKTKIEVVKLLLKVGANDIKAINLAIYEKNQEILDLFISYHDNKKL